MSHSHSHSHRYGQAEDPWNVTGANNAKKTNSPFTWTGKKPYPVQPPASAYVAQASLVNGHVVTQPGVIPPPSALEPVKPLSFHDAISSSSAAEIEAMLSNDSSVVNERGFNGLYPIHRAALRGDPVIVRLLLRHKADPNAQNEFNETPLHFACKRASVVAIEALIAGGANVKAEDNAGKGVLHHAVQGGSVIVAHYLIEVHRMSSHTRDRNLSTPLHIICAHGHAEAFEYFCRNNRSDVFGKDAQGNTALHIAAANGNSSMCYSLLEIGGYKLLRELNSEGCTALDFAKRGSQFKYQEVVRMLSYHSAMKRDAGEIKGPLGAWYGLLLLPVIFYPASITLAFCFSNKGPVTLVSILAILFFRLHHSHRIAHYCRWPSPAHAGLFFAGMFYTLLCVIFLILPHIYSYTMWLTCLSPLLAALMIYMYAVLLTRDPGIVKYPRMKNDALCSYYTIQDVATEAVKPSEFCSKCELISPTLSTHCRLCDCCYNLVDHHCLYLYRCIARDNHRLFVGFNIVVMAAMLLFEYSVYIYITLLYTSVEVTWDIALLIFANEPIIWSLAVLNAVSVVWLVYVLRIQLEAVAEGRILAYKPHGASRLTSKQRFMNIVYFILNKNKFVRSNVLNT